MNIKRIIAFILSIFFLFAFTGCMNKTSSTYSPIGIIRIDGQIVGGESSVSLFGSSAVGSETIMKQLREAQKDSTKVIILRINSPGGSSPASEEIYEEVVKLKKAGKKVIVSMGDVAASGGYMIACAGDYIYALPSTMTGSIGSIIEWNDYSDLYDKYGINNHTIKSGKYKDIGSPSRKPTQDEIKLLQDTVNETYEYFVDIVSKERKIPKSQLKKIADGRIITGKKAVEYKLVDEIGNLYDAIDKAKSILNISGSVKIKEYTTKKTLIEQILGT
ncbi:signal peptide peptidase SppA [Caldicellulosiruptoraceae bacterium PP1]